MAEIFQLLPLRFRFRAEEALHFPAGQAGNIVRGAFGSIFRKLVCDPQCHDPDTCEARHHCPYARIFTPRAAGRGPSGLANWPRPFVFRAYHLEGRRLPAGYTFHFDLHLFDAKEPSVGHFIRSFAQLAHQGLGPGRGRARLERVELLDADGRPGLTVYEKDTSPIRENPPLLALDLAPHPGPVGRVLVRFHTPTELKSGDTLPREPEFAALFARTRDRLSTLRALYGSGPLQIDFKSAGLRASRVKLIRCDIHHVAADRRSSRTGQVHPIGGFVGEADYEGDLAEFIPYLRIARWTGVGRQTVWGKGAIEATVTG